MCEIVCGIVGTYISYLVLGQIAVASFTVRSVVLVLVRIHAVQVPSVNEFLRALSALNAKRRALFAKVVSRPTRPRLARNLFVALAALVVLLSNSKNCVR